MEAAASEPGLAARPAQALNRADSVSRIVVGELGAALDVPGGNDPDGVADDPRIAVRRAGVIDIARDVAADRGIADVMLIQLEAPDVALFEVAPLALQAFLVPDLLAGVMNDALVLG